MLRSKTPPHIAGYTLLSPASWPQPRGGFFLEPACAVLSTDRAAVDALPDGLHTSHGMNRAGADAHAALSPPHGKPSSTSCNSASALWIVRAAMERMNRR